MVTCNPDFCLIRMFFASQIQLHIPTDVPLICQIMASKGFVGDRLLTNQAKKIESGGKTRQPGLHTRECLAPANVICKWFNFECDFPS